MKRKNNMIASNRISVDDKSMCSGCGACQYVCPVNAISFIDDTEGYRVPNIKHSICIECGKCKIFCHLQNPVRVNMSKKTKHYAVKIDDERRRHSRSGGAFVAISDYVLENGGVVFGATMNEEFKVSHICAVNKKERDMLCGSKYVQSNMENVFGKIANKLECGKRVLFCGPPCQVSAIAKVFSPEKYSNLLLMDFVCHGVPSPGLWSDYIKWVQQHYKKNLIDIDFRDKEKYPWESHVQRLEFEHKTVWSKRFTNLFTSNLCLRESCYKCPYARMERVSDFTLGDYWGIDNIDNNFNDGKGISLLITRSSKASEIFEMIKGSIRYIDTTEHKLEHYNLQHPTNRPDGKDIFWKEYHQNGFEFVSNKYGRYDIVHRIKYKIIDHMD